MNGFIPANEDVNKLIKELVKFRDTVSEETILAYNREVQQAYLSELINTHTNPRDAKPGYVYLISNPNTSNSETVNCKIGLSKNPQQRISQIRRKVKDVRLVHDFPADNMAVAEFLLHDRYAAQRTNGEWFAFDQADIDYIKSIERYEDGEFIFSALG